MFCQCWMECLGRSLQTEYAESCPRVVLGWKTFSSKSRRVTFWSSSISAGRPCRGELGLPWAALMAYAAQHSAAVSLFHRNTSIVRRASSCSSWIFDSKCSLSPAMFAIPAPHWSINHRLIQTKSPDSTTFPSDATPKSSTAAVRGKNPVGFSKIWKPNTTMRLSCGTLAYVAPEVCFARRLLLKKSQQKSGDLTFKEGAFTLW